MKKLIIANWKCNPTTLKKAKELFDSVKKITKHLKDTKVVICPPFVYLSELIRTSAKSLGGFVFGSQNCFWEKSGSFTGEISPLMLKNLGCEYVILGHSERRKHLKETGGMINKKLRVALEAGLKPILCIGETKTEKEQGKTKNILKQQLKEFLDNSMAQLVVSEVEPSLNHLILVYEPIWAIGTGDSCNPGQAAEVLSFLKELLSVLLNPEILKNIQILYGGSVNSDNGLNYINTGFDGLLVGAASLTPEFPKLLTKLI